MPYYFHEHCGIYLVFTLGKHSVTIPGEEVVRREYSDIFFYKYVGLDHFLRFKISNISFRGGGVKIKEYFFGYDEIVDNFGGSSQFRDNFGGN